MKLTRWEFERILEALDNLIEDREDQGESVRNVYRLRDKVLSYGEVTGKYRG